MQVYVGYIDVVTPERREADFTTMLDQPSPHLRVYLPETVVTAAANDLIFHVPYVAVP